ncbi:MAG: hypothetical protein R3F29_03945 [Planctomycetota bacterium]
MTASFLRRGWLLLGLAALPSCAWSNPANRPVWNAFEQHLVPDDGGLFYATLPLTVPGGLLALLTDTLIVHPAQIVDDAVDDAGELWIENDPDWDEAYYTEMAYLPFRVVFTPVVFAGSFVGRSLFDIDSGDADASRETVPEQPSDAQLEAWAATKRQLFVDWLAGLHAAPEAPLPALPEWRNELAAPLAAAMQQGATVRSRVYTALLGVGVVRFGELDVAQGLSDPDAVVRFQVLQRWPSAVPLTAAQVGALQQDPSESVRQLLARRGGR